MIRPIKADDMADMVRARALLQGSSLPVDGIDAESVRLFVLEEAEVVGLVAYEAYLPYALLRSLVLASSWRGQGKGRLLLDFVLAEAKNQGFKAAYGLSTTIPDWLLRLGFKEISRQDLPEQLYASKELQGACPASARVFVKYF